MYLKYIFHIHCISTTIRHCFFLILWLFPHWHSECLIVSLTSHIDLSTILTNLTSFSYEVSFFFSASSLLFIFLPVWLAQLVKGLHNQFLFIHIRSWVIYFWIPSVFTKFNRLRKLLFPRIQFISFSVMKIIICG